MIGLWIGRGDDVHLVDRRANRIAIEIAGRNESNLAVADHVTFPRLDQIGQG